MSLKKDEDCFYEDEEEEDVKCQIPLLTVGVMDYAHKKEQNLTANILTTTKEIKKRLLTLVHNGVGYCLRQVWRKTELFWRS